MSGRSLISLVFIVFPGLAAVAVSGYYLLIEWATLDANYAVYAQAVKSSSSTMRDLFVTEAAQNIHRINCFAEGVGVLLGWIIVAIGIHSLCALPRRSS